MVKVITYGTYDLLHYGHINLLKRAKALGDYLIVGVTAEDFDKTRGKINVQQSLMERVEAVRATGIADEIIIEEYEGQKIDDIGLLTIAMSFGIAGVAKDFIPLFYGPGYEPCILLTVLFTPILVIKSYSVTVRTQYLIPLGLEKDFTISVILGAIVNVFFNLLLIPKYGAVGAVIGTFLAELSSCIFQFWAIRKEISIRRCVHSFPMYLVFGIIMVILVDISTLKIQSHFIGLFLGIIVGVVSYICLCMVFWRKNKSAVYTEFFEPIFYRLKGTFKH